MKKATVVTTAKIVTSILLLSFSIAGCNSDSSKDKNDPLQKPDTTSNQDPETNKGNVQPEKKEDINLEIKPVGIPAPIISGSKVDNARNALNKIVGTWEISSLATTRTDANIAVFQKLIAEKNKITMKVTPPTNANGTNANLQLQISTQNGVSPCTVSFVYSTGYCCAKMRKLYVLDMQSKKESADGCALAAFGKDLTDLAKIFDSSEKDDTAVNSIYHFNFYSDHLNLRGQYLSDPDTTKPFENHSTEIKLIHIGE